MRKGKNFFLKTAFKAAALSLIFFVSAAIIVEIVAGLQHSVWDGRSSLYFVVQQGDLLWVVKSNKNYREIKTIRIPPSAVISVSHGFGEQQAKNIYKLGKQEKIGGRELVETSIAWTLALPVKAAIYSPKAEENLHLAWLLVKSFLGLTETDLSHWDQWRLFWFFRSQQLGRFESFELNELPGVVQEERPDGLPVWHINVPQLDSWMGQHFSDQDFAGEGYTWEVVNATGKEGLATQIARFLTNSGLRVVRTSDGQFSESAVATGPQVDSPAARFFREYFQIKEMKTDNGVQSDISLILSDDFWKKCCEN